MCIITKDVRDRLLKKVRFASKNELIELLTFLFQGNRIRNDIQVALCKDIVDEHGQVAFFNIRAIIEDGNPSAPTSQKGILSNIRYDKKKTSMPNIINEVRIKSNPAKQNIVEDLTRSFLMDKKIRDSGFKEALKNMTSGRR